jgi:hypothetical protein
MLQGSQPLKLPAASSPYAGTKNSETLSRQRSVTREAESRMHAAATEKQAAGSTAQVCFGWVRGGTHWTKQVSHCSCCDRAAVPHACFSTTATVQRPSSTNKQLSCLRRHCSIALASCNVRSCAWTKTYKQHGDEQKSSSPPRCNQPRQTLDSIVAGNMPKEFPFRVGMASFVWACNRC